MAEDLEKPQKQQQQQEPKPTKLLFPPPPGPGEEDRRPGWLKFVDNPLGETIRAVNKVEDAVAKKFSKNKTVDEDATVATEGDGKDDNTKPPPPAAI